jgi:hypothetical protein
MRPFFALLNEVLNPPQRADLVALDLFENLNIGPKTPSIREGPLRDRRETDTCSGDRIRDRRMPAAPTERSTQSTSPSTTAT